MLWRRIVSFIPEVVVLLAIGMQSRCFKESFHPLLKLGVGGSRNQVDQVELGNLAQLGGAQLGNLGGALTWQLYFAPDS